MSDQRLSKITSLITCVLLLGSAVTALERPHIVVIMADDFGWSDVGYRNPDMVTPNIDRMAKQGVKLKYSYMNQVCTPSRAAFMTGIYPYKMGLQDASLKALVNNSLPLEYKLLPQHLKELGYSTHFIGKWHLGFCNYAMTPTYRGFDTFYGMYLGKGTYYSHTGHWDGYDHHHDVGKNPKNFKVLWSEKGRYSTTLYTRRAKKIIRAHDKSKPLFLVVSYQAVHGPLQVPQKYLDNECSHVTESPERKLHCAMAAAMDVGIGAINRTLFNSGLYDNVITLFISDNGGPIKFGSSNWPLRGSKITLWEGGTRVVSILHSKTHLPKAPYEFNGLIHGVDWYPTLMRAAGYKRHIKNIDGVNSWIQIRNNQKYSARNSFVYNINDISNTSAIRSGAFKLINNKPGSPDGWYNPPAGVINDKKPPPKKYPEFMLYNIEEDPTEENDLADKRKYKKLLAAMKKQLRIYKRDMVHTLQKEKVELGKPTYHNGSWVPGWC